NMHAAYGIFFGTPLFGITSVVQLTSATNAYKIPVIPFPFSVLPFTLPGHKFPEGNQIPPGVDFIPQLSTVFTFDRNLRNSYTQQVTAGIDYLLDDKTQLSVIYDFVRGNKLISLRNINPVTRPVPGSTLTSLLTGRLDPTRGEVDEYESAFDS